MPNPFRTLATILFIGTCTTALSAAPAEPAAPKADDPSHKVTTYKTTPQGELKIEIFFPPEWKASDKRPAIVFFFGGGWTNGDRKQFVPQCQYFAGRGMVAATADYRIKSKHGTTPDKCVEDAKSAVRWVRQHAGELGVDPAHLAAGGGSAGGHLAAATALVPGFDAAGEDAAVSLIPNALVLFNPVMDLSGIALHFMPGAAEEQAKLARDLSPNRYLSKQTAPMILFFGTDDALGATGQQTLDKSPATGNRVELYLADGMKHGFFNKSPWLEATMRQADEFLASLGYLQGKPTIELNAKATLKRAEPGKAGR